MRNIKPNCLGLILLFLSITPILQAQSSSWEWAKSAGVTSYASGNSIYTDTKGYVYVTGYFGGNITFGNTTLISTGPGNNIFIVKYDTSGNVIWTKSANDTVSALSHSICTDAKGNVYVTGEFSSPTITFGGHTLTNVDSPAMLNGNVFIVKYDVSGNVAWAKSGGGTGSSKGIGVSTDANGNIYLVGSYYIPSITFGGITLSDSNGGNYSLFIVKYDTSGNVIWARSGGGIDPNESLSISADLNGNTYLTGAFDGPATTFGSITLSIAGGYSKLFVVKYNTAGTPVWVQGATPSGPYSEEGDGISADANGDVYLTGYFSTDSITFGNTILTNIGIGNMFLVKYDSAGTIIWAKTMGGTGADKGSSVSTDADGNVYMTGFYSSPVITFGSTILFDTNAGNYCLFIAKYDASGNAVWAKSAGGSGISNGDGIACDATGNAYVTGFFNNPDIIFGATTLTDTSSAYFQYYIAKYNGSGSLNTGIRPIVNPTSPITVYPNPSGGMFYFSGVASGSTIEAYDLLGQSATPPQLSIPPLAPPNIGGEQTATKTVDLSGRPAGVYFYRVTDSNGLVRQGKIVVE